MSGTPGNPRPYHPSRGILLMVLAMLLFASMDAGSKILIQTYSVIQILWVRFLFFFALALIIAMANGGIRAAARTRRPGIQVLRAFVIVAEIAAFVLAFQHMGLADVHAIAAMTPLIVTALSVPVLGERVGKRRWLAVLAGFAGMLIIVRPGLGITHPAAGLAIAAAGLFAAYQLLTRIAGRHDSATTSLLYMAGVGVVALSVIGPFHWKTPVIQENWWAYWGGDWGLFFLVGLLGCGAHFALIEALRLAPAAVVQPFNYALFVWATVIGYLVFGEFPDAATVAGGGLVIGSGLYAFYREQRAAAFTRAGGQPRRR